MNFRSNKVNDIREYYLKELSQYYPANEAKVFLDMIFESFFGLSRIERSLNPGLLLSESEILRLNIAVKELKSYHPIQYILGFTEFCGLKFFTDERALIPRPETEELVYWIREHIESARPDITLLDIGTGCGCIPISLKTFFDEAEMWAMDVSGKALELCEKNAAGQEVQIKTVLDNILSQPSAIHYPEFDIIVSNPPYVTESEKTEMQPNVLDFEPQQALFVDDTDALIYYRQICDFAVRHLKPDGLLFFEINQRFGKEVIEMLEHSQMKRIELRKDLFGRDRMIRAEKRIVNKTY